MAGITSATIVLGCVAANATADAFQVQVLSTRADLVSGGQALTRIALPAGTDPSTVTVSLNGSDVTRQFALRADGEFEGLLSGMVNGTNTVTAALADGTSTSTTIVNHPFGGPTLSGPQVQPWVCEAGAVDAQCNKPATISYDYMPATDQAAVDGLTGPTDQSSAFRSYDPSNPPAANEIATVTTDNGTTVPYIVRVETGYIDRDQYSYAVLWQPGQPWQPWAPQPQFDHKLVVTHGASCGDDHTTSTAPSTLFDPGLSRGMAVMSTAMDNSGHDCNVVTEGESVIMAKEHLIDEFGTLRYTIGSGCSGGSLVQQQVGNAFPGVYQGLLPQCSFPDSVSNGQQVDDYQLVNTYFQNPAGWGTGVAWNPAQIAAVQDHPNYANSVEFTTLYFTSNSSPSYACAGVTAAQLYNAQSNPAGVRCDLADYAINLYGPRVQSTWDAQEKQVGHGFAGSPMDNVGVQYGLNALEAGIISPAQFVDINRKVGGFDTDANPIASRTVADQPALQNAYRGGAIDEANNLTDVAIIDLRGPDEGSFHDAYRSFTMRARLEAAEGHFPMNQVIWYGPVSLLGSPNYVAQGVASMDQWLSAVEADHRSISLADKVAKDRPASVHDQCEPLGGVEQVSVPGVGPVCEYPLVQARYGTPRMAAGEPINTDNEKCTLKPLRESDYYPITFTPDEWATLQQTFPTGVCDFSQPGVGQQPVIPWQNYQNPDGSVIYGGQPLGPAPAGSGLGWTSPSFEGWLGK
jgi:hypothetical protein